MVEDSSGGWPRFQWETVEQFMDATGGDPKVSGGQNGGGSAVKQPDVTVIQIVAVAKAVLGLTAAYGLVIANPAQVQALEVAILAMAPIILSLGLVGADKGIRKARNERMAQESHERSMAATTWTTIHHVEDPED